MELKNRDLFELEAAIVNGCKTKHWALVKPLNKMLATLRAITVPHLESLKPTAAMQKYNAALRELRARSAGDKPEELAEKIRLLKIEHIQAHVDGEEIQQLDIEMEQDKAIVELEPIDEKLFHDGGVLRVEPETFFTLSRLGLVKE